MIVILWNRYTSKGRGKIVRPSVTDRHKYKQLTVYIYAFRINFAPVQLILLCEANRK
jgi:hypothetical protein